MASNNRATTTNAISQVSASAYSIPTETPESDGTLKWTSTTLVLVQVTAASITGSGYSYTSSASANVVDEVLAPAVIGRDPMDIPGSWEAMRRAIRNLGRTGIVSTSISAVDVAVWDLKARLLGIPVSHLLGRCHETIPVYGSGGFTSYDLSKLRDQLGRWAHEGLGMVKMKVGRDPKTDIDRVTAARKAIGDNVMLFVDANGAYSRKQALYFAQAYAELEVCWFEEPVSSDDVDGLRLIRDRAPAGMDITAGEYGYDLFTLCRLLDHGSVDVLQADATRCGGISEFLRVGALCEAKNIPLSSHCAPLIHLDVACAIHRMRHMEYFFDHVRIERLLFDGVPRPEGGLLKPNSSRPGHGWEFKQADAEKFRVR